MIHRTATTASIDRILGDTRLLALAREGSAEAADALLARHSGRVAAIFRRIHRVPEADLPDLMQEVSLGFLRYLHRITNAEGFLTMAATRTALNYRRGRLRLARFLKDYAHTRRGEALSPSSRVERLLARSLDLHAAISAIDPRHADLLRAVLVEGVSYAEYARRAGMPVGSIGPMVGRSMKQIRRVLQAADRVGANKVRKLDVRGIRAHVDALPPGIETDGPVLQEIRAQDDVSPEIVDDVEPAVDDLPVDPDAEEDSLAAHRTSAPARQSEHDGAAQPHRSRESLCDVPSHRRGAGPRVEQDLRATRSVITVDDETLDDQTHAVPP